METLAINYAVESASYQIRIGRGIRRELPQFLADLDISQSNPLLIITDSNVGPLYLSEIEGILQDFPTVSYVVPAGEDSKSLAQIESLTAFALEQGLGRQTLVLALGGGVVGDLAGFFAATYMRGLKFLQLPTTILAHDSSVGGKVAVNHALGKNMIGAFHQPIAVVYDLEYLLTLPDVEVRSGLAELVKHGLIGSNNLITYLEDKAEQLLGLDLAALEPAIYQGIAIKAEIVAQDPREQGLRAHLNYGHTLAHALESASNYRLGHGEAVAIGIVYAAELAEIRGLIDSQVKERTIALLTSYELPVSIDREYQAEALYRMMLYDKKARNRQLQLVLPTSIGSVAVVSNLDEELLLETIAKLQI